MSSQVTEPPTMQTDVDRAATHLWRQGVAAGFVRIGGNSMVPLLRAGDEVRVERLPQHWRDGDLLVFEREGQLVVHRLLCVLAEIKGGVPRYITQGDNALIPDAPIEVAQIAGRVVAVRRGPQVVGLDTRGWRLLGKVLVVLAGLPWQPPARAVHVRLRRWAARLCMG